MYAHPALRIDPHILETGVVYYKKWQDRDVIVVRDHLGYIEIFETVDYNLLQAEKELTHKESV